jgi:hypothetical protein
VVHIRIVGGGGDDEASDRTDSGIRGGASPPLPPPHVCVCVCMCVCVCVCMCVCDFVMAGWGSKGERGGGGEKRDLQSFYSCVDIDK